VHNGKWGDVHFRPHFLLSAEMGRFSLSSPLLAFCCLIVDPSGLRTACAALSIGAVILFAVNRQHNEQISAERNALQRQLECDQNAAEARCKALMEDKQRVEKELEIHRREHKAKCEALSKELESNEKNMEQLKGENLVLKTLLERDHDQKVQMLNAEVHSLQTALEMKTEEMKQARKTNSELQLRVEEMEAKDIEISKLKHRNGELKALVEQLRNTEKSLMAQYEQLQRSARTHAEMSESMSKENDTLRYRLEEVSGCATPSDNFFTPRPPNRAPLQETSYRTIPRRSRSTHSDSQPPMTRSTESGGNSSPPPPPTSPMHRSVISFYQESGRRFPAANADVIYAPEGTFVTDNL